MPGVKELLPQHRDGKAGASVPERKKVFLLREGGANGEKVGTKIGYKAFQVRTRGELGGGMESGQSNLALRTNVSFPHNWFFREWQQKTTFRLSHPGEKTAALGGKRKSDEREGRKGPLKGDGETMGLFRRDGRDQGKIPLTGEIEGGEENYSHLCASGICKGRRKISMRG